MQSKKKYNKKTTTWYLECKYFQSFNGLKKAELSFQTESKQTHSFDQQLNISQKEVEDRQIKWVFLMLFTFKDLGKLDPVILACGKTQYLMLDYFFSSNLQRVHDKTLALASLNRFHGERH